MPPVSASFQPTSLDFINFPNPVEPSIFDFGVTSSTNRHSGGPSEDDLFWSLPDIRVEDGDLVYGHTQAPSRKRRRDGHFASSYTGPSVLNPADAELVPGRSSHHRTSDQGYFTLPLPPQSRDSERQRQLVPPVLQGLHQPPPNAGLLPSISTVERTAPAGAARSKPVAETAAVPLPATASRRKSVVPASSAQQHTDKTPARTTTKQKRHKWTDQETRHLLQGVQRFGVGAWTKILTCEDYIFDARRPLDLKDRFRVVSSNPALLASSLPVAVQQRGIDIVSATKETTISTDTPTSNPVPQAPSVPDAPVATDDTTRGSEAGGHGEEEQKRVFKRLHPRRPRTTWSAEEDAALLAGLERYGTSWTSIALAPCLRHKHRTAMDVRDRVRSRFGKEYVAAGLVLGNHRSRGKAGTEGSKGGRGGKGAVLHQQHGDGGDGDAAEDGPSRAESSGQAQVGNGRGAGAVSGAQVQHNVVLPLSRILNRVPVVAGGGVAGQ